MRTENKYIKKLLQGYLDKTLTKRELAIFFDLLEKGELDYYLEEDMISSTPDKISIKNNKPLKIISYSIAAAIIFAFGIFGYLSIHQDNSINHTNQNKAISKVVPGKEHAILRLSDGTEIMLDSVFQSDPIVLEKAGKINHQKGELQYDLSKLNLDKSQLKNEYHTIETPKGGTYKVTLSDGTKVWLNSYSKIKFPLVFGDNSRQVETEGEIFFDVSPEQNRPFIVKTSNQKIRVLGTSFNINSYSDEPYIKTTLVSGKIRLETDKDNIIIRPGEEVINRNGKVNVKIADLDQVIAWKDGYFIFNKVDVKTLMRQISRWYNVSIVYKSEVSSDQFVGKINRQATIDDVINIFNEGGVKLQLENRTIIVK